MTQLPTMMEVYGIAMANNGQSCTRHPVCGAELVLGDVLIFSLVTVDSLDGQLENAVAAVSQPGQCRVGFLPRFLLAVQGSYIGRKAVVESLGRTSTSKHQILHDYRNGGTAVVRFK
ncbi:hypothetical protein HDU80_000437, partial [Chytriomyces hyalinus]